MYCNDRYFAIRCAEIILMFPWDYLSTKLATEIFPIAGVMRVFMHARTRVRILFGYNVCASRIHTIDRGWMREKEREKKEKRGRGRMWKRWGREERETASARKYKEPDRARNFSPFHIFHAENTTPSNKVRLSILLFCKLNFKWKLMTFFNDTIVSTSWIILPATLYWLCVNYEYLCIIFWYFVNVISHWEISLLICSKQ